MRIWPAVGAFAAIVATHVPVAASEGVIAVLGGGLAGLTATLSAVEHGAKVILIEKESRLGGNSAKATSGINGVGTRGQRMAHVTDSVEKFFKETIKAGHEYGDRELVSILAEHSGSAIEFVESFGVDLSVVSQLGGHSVPRTHREPTDPKGRPRPIGFDIVNALKHKVEKLVEAGQVKLCLGCKLVDLDPHDATWNVKYIHEEHEKTIHVGSVILTTGGYSSARDTILAKHAPHLKNLPTTNGPWAQGEGVAIAEKLGVATIDLEQVQVHPTGFVDPANPNADVVFLAPEALRGSGAILLNNRGERFVNELAPRDEVTGSIWRFSNFDPEFIPSDTPVHEETPRDSEAYLIMNDAIADRFGRASFNFYHQVKKFFVALKGTTALADYIAKLNEERDYPLLVPTEHLSNFLDEYVEASTGRRHDLFGKQAFPDSFESCLSEAEYTFYVARVKPAIHYTMGGLKIDSTATLLNQSGDRVNGLFAAGEVTGGVHGHNRLGGNSLLECVVFGRIAGLHAAKVASGVAVASHDEL